MSKQAKQTESEPRISKTEPLKHTKTQILQSTRYTKQRDILNALIEDRKTYTIAEVDNIIGAFSKRKVN